MELIKGDKELNLKKAVELIEADENIKVLGKSDIYETKPFGYTDQDNFLNAVILVETEFGPKKLFRFLKETEEKIGRTKSEKWGPREIDLDLLFYDKAVYSDYELKIPHRGITERDFVIVPLLDLNAEIVHPETELKISEIDLSTLSQNIIKKSEFKL